MAIRSAARQIRSASSHPAVPHARTRAGGLRGIRLRRVLHDVRADLRGVWAICRGMGPGAPTTVPFTFVYDAL